MGFSFFKDGQCLLLDPIAYLIWFWLPWPFQGDTGQMWTRNNLK